MFAAPPALAMFEFLDLTHKTIQEELGKLRVLVQAIEAEKISPMQQKSLATICDYFEHEVKHHHLDEEKHVFPAVYESSDPQIHQVADQLKQDHGWLEQNWLELSPSLVAASQGNNWFDMAELAHGFEVFEALYADHMVLEESIAFKSAQDLPRHWDTMAIGREMAQRRAAKKHA